MSVIKPPQTPQVQIGISQEKQQSLYRSLKVEKSRNSIVEQNDESVTILKQRTHQGDLSNCYDHSQIQKLSPNDTRLMVNNQLNSDEAAGNAVTPRLCCYCGESQNLIPICQCSYAHQNCANNQLKSGPLMEKIVCGKCKEYKHVYGEVCFEFAQWRKFKYSIFFESLFLLIILIAIAALTYFSVIQLFEDLANDRFLISCLVFSFTVGFILVICLITKIITHFKKIQFIIKSYDPKNSEYNRNYINLIMSI